MEQKSQDDPNHPIGEFYAVKYGLPSIAFLTVHLRADYSMCTIVWSVEIFSPSRVQSGLHPMKTLCPWNKGPSVHNHSTIYLRARSLHAKIIETAYNTLLNFKA